MSWFQGGCLQSPDHQIGIDQYRRSGRLYSTDAYAVHSVPRFGVNMVTCVVKKNWHDFLGLNETHWRMVTVWFDGYCHPSFLAGKRFGTRSIAEWSHVCFSKTRRRHVWNVCLQYVFFFGLQEYDRHASTRMKHISKNPCFWWEERMFFHLDIDCEL